MNITIRTVLLLAAGAIAAPAAAQTQVNEQRPLASGGRVEIDNVAGSLDVRGWDRNEVALVGTLGEGQRLDVQSSANRVQLRVVYPRDRHGSSDGARLQLKVPRGADLQANTVSASIDIAEVELARLQAESVSGGLRAAGRARETQLQTVSGGIQSRVATPRLRGSTISGRLSVGEGATRDIGVETVSGRIDVVAAGVSRLRANTVSGAIDVATTGMEPGGGITLETVSGGITLALPRSTSAQLRVNTFSGDIDSDAGQVERPRYGPGRSLEATLGGGNGDVTVESHSGSVRVRSGS